MTKNIRKKRSPGGRLVEHNIKKKGRRSYCRVCGSLLHIKTVKDSKSGKHAERPYGGEICHACLRTTIQSISM
ncbi:MAG: hypothetical protein ACFFB2_10600 [Promethearchaeota archaeon]